MEAMWCEKLMVPRLPRRVSGRRESADPSVTSNRVTVEFCEYSQYPAYDDMIELLELRKEGRISVAPGKFPLFWWSRKGNGAGNNKTYETGICNLVGSDWIVRNNDIHDAFEGLSTWAIRWSKGLVVASNRLSGWWTTRSRARTMPSA